MIDLMRKAIEVLKIKVNSNLEVIKQNEIQFHKMLSDGMAVKDHEEMNRIILLNKNLLNENFDYINVQISMLKFLEKYQHQKVFTELQSKKVESNTEEKKEAIDFFVETLSGNILFDSDHPLFNDEDFFSRLLRHFEDNEEYEKCAELVKIKKERSN
jgi:hypothetical protein